MFGSAELYAAYNIPAITALVGTYEEKPGIFHNTLIPQLYPDKAASINFYIPSNNPIEDVGIYSYLTNARADTFGESRALADAIIENVHRVTYGDHIIILNIGMTLPPKDETDNFNTLLETTIKLRS